MSITSAPLSAAKPTAAPSIVATSVNSPASRVAGGRHPGCLLGLGVVVGRQLGDACAEDFSEERRVAGEKRPQPCGGFGSGGHRPRPVLPSPACGGGQGGDRFNNLSAVHRPVPNPPTQAREGAARCLLNVIAQSIIVRAPRW